MNVSISEQQMKDLIDSQQVISNGRLVSHFKSFDPNSYRILERPLVQLLIDDLIAGSWTVEELASKYGIQKQDVRKIVNPLMGDVAAFDGGYIPLRTAYNDPNGGHRKYRFSLIPIPIRGRIFDPTLGFSLLKWSEFLNDEDKSSTTPYEIQKEAFFQNLTLYWGIPEDIILKHFNSEKTFFVDTLYGPLPVLSDRTLYQQIWDKFTDTADILARKYGHRNLKTEYQYYQAFLSQGLGSIPDLQYCVVNLCNTMNYCRYHGLGAEYSRFQKVNKCLFKMITLNLDASSLPRANFTHRKTETIRKSKNLKYPKKVQKKTVHKKSTPTKTSKKYIQNELVPTKNSNKYHTKEDPDSKINSIIPSLHSSDPLVQIRAIKKLSLMKNDKSLSLLHKVALRYTQSVAVCATTSIKSFPFSRTSEVLADILQSTPHPKARVIAAQALSDQNTPASIMALEKGLSDSNVLVREECVRSLGVIGSPQAVAILQTHLNKEQMEIVRGEIERILNQ
ncbi:HEAT repeat domain-containing protein [Methanofollis formosanus]|uniref:HEAT repeat domain-containing protein n=1 Tax=Methanofollis formosanus TaxID=299308 RepID=A0A8G1A081_9EURY|nr:HEAT repeat domain-containing protein [Methanofollis formosanus]QYZ78056.1 HEAT repeat domain-containing protein [Methanofollis formosanus]